MTPTDLHTAVGQWVARYPQTSRVFEALRIDYCCGGGTSLEEACRDRQLDPQAVAEQLERAVTSNDESAEDWQSAKLAALCDHIEQTHHAYLKQELPRLAGLIEKVLNAHRTMHPELAELSSVFTNLRAELEPHMVKEERVLFPAIRHLDQSATVPFFPFGALGNPIAVMEHEHDHAGDCLARIRRLTNDYVVPDGACNTYRAMLDGLHDLETNMHTHVHKENNILFPRAREQEAQRRGG